MPCLGWGGSICLGPGDDASMITDKELCEQSQARLGLKSFGWHFGVCASSKNLHCSLIGEPGLCEKVKHKLNCAGWGGSRCLATGATASSITSEDICRGSKGLLGIASRGWGGSSCLGEDTDCTEITSSGICDDAGRQLGLECKWSGSFCAIDR